MRREAASAAGSKIAGAGPGGLAGRGILGGTGGGCHAGHRRFLLVRADAGWRVGQDGDARPEIAVKLGGGTNTGPFGRKMHFL